MPAGARAGDEVAHLVPPSPGRPAHLQMRVGLRGCPRGVEGRAPIQVRGFKVPLKLFTIFLDFLLFIRSCLIGAHDTPLAQIWFFCLWFARIAHIWDLSLYLQFGILSVPT